MSNDIVNNQGNKENLEKIKVQIINEKIVAYSNQKISLDIEEGKMGYCIYFFELARLTNNLQYQKLAEKLLDDIYSELVNDSTTISTYELAQIGMSIDYLLKQKFVEGNINSILGDIDSLIFKTIAFEKNPITYRTNGIIPVLLFICNRINSLKKGSDARFIMEDLCIKLFNDLCQSFDPGFYDEPYLFNMLKYKLPQFLFVISKMVSLQFYNYRIIEVIKEISGLIQSRIPALHSNRLYLLWSLLHLKSATGLGSWNEQIDILVNHIDYQKIIYEELRNKDLFIQDGVAGIYLLLNALKNTTLPLSFDKVIIRKRIEESEIWKDERALENKGLINGFSGTLWVYYSIISQK